MNEDDPEKLKLLNVFEDIAANYAYIGKQLNFIAWMIALFWLSWSVSKLWPFFVGG